MNQRNPIIAELLRNRGISEDADLLEFLSDKPQLTYNPFLLLNLEAGVDFLLSAIEQQKKICIYGDYDADGITSICLLMQVMSNLTDNLTYYIPSRFHEGYGLNIGAIDKIRADGVDLILTVDCGSVSYEEVEYAKAAGLDMVVTDHHSITDKIAHCILINPKQPGCAYPFKHLAGCGVAFKLAQGLQIKGGLPKRALLDVLDLVALGTIGDIVSLTGENRTLVKYGLKAVNGRRRKGLAALMEAISLRQGQIRSDQVAYAIVPHLNAAGRMKAADLAVELLLSQSEHQIRDAVWRLVENNKQRKAVQEETYGRCLKLAEEQCEGDLFLVIDAPEAHEGIAGIVAGKIKENRYRPAVILTPVLSDGQEFLKGTGRSIGPVNLYEVLKKQEHLFEKFGGHGGACGFLMKKENLSRFRAGVCKTMEELYHENPRLFEEKINVDMRLQGKAVTEELVEQLNLFGPFGCDNEKPIFEIHASRLADVNFLGESGNHVRFTAVCEDGAMLSCVFFGKAKERADCLSGGSVKLLGSLDCQEWRGTKRLQLMVDEIEKMV